MGAVLVTGGAGYIGSRVASVLLAQGREVVVLDNLSTGSREWVPSSAEFVMGSVHNMCLVGELLKSYQIKSVLHFAGSIKVEESVRDPLKYYHNNVEGIRCLLEAVYGRVEHFIFSSTAAVYGTPEHSPVAEDAPLCPLSPYGRSKVMAEAILADVALCPLLPIRYAILRYFNVAGGGYELEQRPTHLMRAALAVAGGRQDHLEIFGTDYPTTDGTAVRDYIHLSDLVDAHLLALEHLEDGGASDTYNVGYGHGYSVFEVHAAAERAVGRCIPMRYVGRRQGDAAAVIADASKLRDQLGWRPVRDDLDAMLREQYEWECSQNPPAA